MLTEAQKVQVRRHCGYPVYGNGSTASPPFFGYRYFSWYLNFEYKLNNLSEDEEDLLINTYLVACTNAWNAILDASDNLDTDRAAVWYHNKNETKDRLSFYRLQCQLLIQFLGVDSNIGKVTSGGGSMRVIV